MIEDWSHLSSQRLLVNLDILQCGYLAPLTTPPFVVRLTDLHDLILTLTDHNMYGRNTLDVLGFRMWVQQLGLSQRLLMHDC